ncbi:uncharacterized protein LOC109834105 isoform X2 [Asparagus officinalis]|nr:uncharacterized protein LOC109834105 isoform X2 [Asparagus officinalis]
MQSNAVSEACLRDKRYIKELEKELRNCSLEIGYLQDQLNLRNVESNCMGEHVHSLELKLAEVGSLHEKLKLLSEALMQSDSRNLSLIRDVKDKGEELHNSALQIEELETAISSIALDSQCEIETMRLEIAALEERCFEAERLCQHAAQDKAKMELLLEMSESQFQDAQEKISCLRKENKNLKQKLLLSEVNADGSCCKIGEHLDTWVRNNGGINVPVYGGSFRDLLVKLTKEFPLLKEICISGEVCCPFVSNPALVTALDDNANEEMKKMLNQIRELELQVVQLKEELRAEKLKAKEEAEDLTQEMAELRYQMTDMLEEECKRRASVEQTSLGRIQDLEEQVRKEHKLAAMRAMEISHLKDALQRFRKVTNPETVRKIESCDSGGCIISDNFDKCSTEDTANAEASNGYTSHQALLEWYPDDRHSSTEAEK